MKTNTEQLAGQQTLKFGDKKITLVRDADDNLKVEVAAPGRDPIIVSVPKLRSVSLIYWVAYVVFRGRSSDLSNALFNPLGIMVEDERLARERMETKGERYEGHYDEAKDAYMHFNRRGVWQGTVPEFHALSVGQRDLWLAMAFEAHEQTKEAGW